MIHRYLSILSTLRSLNSELPDYLPTDNAIGKNNNDICKKTLAGLIMPRICLLFRPDKLLINLAWQYSGFHEHIFQDYPRVLQ